MLSRDCIDWVREHLHENPSELLLKYAGKELPFPLKEGVLQVECRRRCASKIPSFLRQDSFRFADLLCSEQASHEAVARYHAQLAAPGARLLDMTAGLGIDAMTQALAGAVVTAVELDPARAEALRENAAVTGAEMQVVCGDSVEYLKNCPENFDLIFIDPARRDSGGRRTYSLADCTPDVLTLMPLLLSKCKRLLIKASPLLDLKQVCRDVPQCTSLRVTSAGGECKELLIEAEAGGSLREIVAVDIDRHGTVHEFFSSPAEHTAPRYSSAPGRYLYEPSPSLMKTAPWGELCARFKGLTKLDVSSHLFVSEELLPGFPGRTLRIESIPDKAALKALKGKKINVVSRNHPLTPEQLRKKYGLLSSAQADLFLYATRIAGRPNLLIARMV